MPEPKISAEKLNPVKANLWRSYPRKLMVPFIVKKVLSVNSAPASSGILTLPVSNCGDSPGPTKNPVWLCPLISKTVVGVSFPMRRGPLSEKVDPAMQGYEQFDPSRCPGPSPSAAKVLKLVPRRSDAKPMK